MAMQSSQKAATNTPWGHGWRGDPWSEGDPWSPADLWRKGDKWDGGNAGSGGNEWKPGWRGGWGDGSGGARGGARGGNRGQWRPPRQAAGGADGGAPVVLTPPQVAHTPVIIENKPGTLIWQIDSGDFNGWPQWADACLRLRLLSLIHI